jgi:lysophospholipase L1-like esterase
MRQIMAKIILVKVLLLVVSLSIALALGELVLRRFVDLPRGIRQPQVRYDPHPVRRFTLRAPQQAYTFSLAARIDDAGFRATGREPVRQDALKLFALGDSFTFGMGVADDETWPAQLESLLNAHGEGAVLVINGGTTSYGVFQEYDLFRERGLPTDSAVVIHALYWNDYMSARAPAPTDAAVLADDGYFVWDNYQPPAGRIGRAMKWAANNSAFIYIMKRTARDLIGDERGLTEYEAAYQDFIAGRVNEEEWAPIARFYEDLQSLGEAHGFDVYAVILPVLGLLDSQDASRHPFVRYVRDLLERQHIAYIDGITLWRERGYGRETFLPHNRHLNEEGYAVIAEELDRLLYPKLPLSGVRAIRGSSHKERRLSDSTD